MKNHKSPPALKGQPTLATLDSESDREVRAWKAAAWAPVGVGIIGLIFAVIDYFFK